jgi:hypothetical protein
LGAKQKLVDLKGGVEGNDSRRWQEAGITFFDRPLDQFECPKQTSDREDQIW